jgi:hypothetical protein
MRDISIPLKARQRRNGIGVLKKERQLVPELASANERQSRLPLKALTHEPATEEGGKLLPMSHDAEARMSALPRTNDLGLEKANSWMALHGYVSKLWWQADRAPVGHLGRCAYLRRTVGRPVRCTRAGYFLLLVAISCRRCDLGMAVP